jgi:hypothetical protein
VKVGLLFTTSGILKVSDQVGSFVGLLQASEHHFCSYKKLSFNKYDFIKIKTENSQRSIYTWDVFLGILQVHLKSVLAPDNTLADVGVRVGETWRLAGLASKQTPQIRAGLVLAAVLHTVALRARSHKYFLAVFNAHLATISVNSFLKTGSKTEREKYRS